ncbi:hypothetical protein NC653_026987 [Populus alba x Populus x berolinensis]|uniref:Uncharacterized protein n=1 Tax=Populus alba x Populus x berolinensis TaxID=444605 RepID=A0AAD6Q6A0_9ROSI|nr:hypothetical protein NC653_026987 [Populus alba x Populus x berolinensis]
MPLPASGFPSVLSSPRVLPFSSLCVWFSHSLFSFLSSSLVLLCRPFALFCYSSLFFFFFTALYFISYSAHSLSPLFPAHLCFFPLRSAFSVLFSSVFPLWFFCFSCSPLFFSFPVCCPSSSGLPLLLFSLFSSLSPLFSFSAVSLLFPSPSVQSTSAAFIGQRRLCAGNGWLGNGLQRDDSRDTCPIIEENWHCCCKKTSLGLYC